MFNKIFKKKNIFKLTLLELLGKLFSEAESIQSSGSIQLVHFSTFGILTSAYTSLTLSMLRSFTLTRDSRALDFQLAMLTSFQTLELNSLVVSQTSVITIEHLCSSSSQLTPTDFIRIAAKASRILVGVA